MKNITAEMLNNLTNLGFDIVHDTTRDLYIAYMPELILFDPQDEDKKQSIEPKPLFPEVMPLPVFSGSPEESPLYGKCLDEIVFPNGLPSAKVSLGEFREQFYKRIKEAPTEMAPVAEDTLQRINSIECSALRSLVGNSISLEQLKRMFGGPANQKQEGANCSNKEALRRIQLLENAINNLFQPGKIETLFDYLPYTKSGKFARNKHIYLYIPNIKFTAYDDYFSQKEIALQLAPVMYGYIDREKGYETANMDNVVVLQLSTNACFAGRATPETVIKDDGSFQSIEKKSIDYLKYKDLTKGVSYTDEKGSEYLYLGRVIIHRTPEGYTLPGISRLFEATSWDERINKLTPPLYIRVTEKVKKELRSYSKLEDFLLDRFLKAEYLGLLHGFNQTESKKFVAQNTVYFAPPANVLTKMEFSKDYTNEPITHADYSVEWIE